VHDRHIAPVVIFAGVRFAPGAVDRHFGMSGLALEGEGNKDSTWAP
jgi:hypothetical protein